MFLDKLVMIFDFDVVDILLDGYNLDLVIKVLILV